MDPLLIYLGILTRICVSQPRNTNVLRFSATSHGVSNVPDPAVPCLAQIEDRFQITYQSLVPDVDNAVCSTTQLGSG